MDLTFAPLARSTMGEEISKTIIEMINTGKLKPGVKLPSERELMEKLQVSRSPIREALRSLTLVGVLETIPGDGTYVSKNLASAFISGKLEWAGLLASPDVLELMEVREPLEIQAAGLAAAKATPASVAKLRQVIDSYRVVQGDLEREIEVDVHFHKIIAEITENRILIHLMETIREFWHDYIQKRRVIFSKIATLEQEYLEILNAIEQGDEVRAREAMANHLQRSKQKNLLEQITGQTDLGMKEQNISAEETQG
jgi:GntR family transcriptional repressor for pyruvate dehydrogenase complex